MKKILAMLLAVMMLLSVASVAMAEDTTTPSDQGTVTITKVYKLIGAGTSPAEEFELRQIAKSVTKSECAEADIPDLTSISKAQFAAGAATTAGTEANFTVTLPRYTHVGVYEYTLKETAGTTAGVAYYGNNIKLVVTVINGANDKLRIAAVHTEAEGESKSDRFANTYSAGTLNVTKTVTGNLGDEGKYFEFKVTLTGEPDKTYGESYAVTGGSNASNPKTIKIGEETTFLLKHGDTISIANLPYGVTYTVTETAADGYTTTHTGDTGRISAAEQTAAFTNERKGDIDMGVMLDSMPYVLVLAVVGAAVIALIAKKRRVED